MQVPLYVVVVVVVYLPYILDFGLCFRVTRVIITAILSQHRINTSKIITNQITSQSSGIR